VRRVSIRQFRANMAKELKDLPFEIIKHGGSAGFVYKMKAGATNNQENRVHKSEDVTDRVHNEKPEGMSILRWNYKRKFPEMRCQYCQVKHKDCACGK